MRWEEVFAVFVVCHVTGDFLLQTDWQAVNKRGGLFGQNREARRALISHCSVYTLVYVPALLWVATHKSPLVFALLPVIFIPHMLQDDGKALIAWNRIVKRSAPEPGDPVYMAIDQAFHVVTLFGTALLAVIG